MKRLKLYVWEDVLCDYTAGVMFALAASPKHARELLLAKCPHVTESDLARDPREIADPEGFVVWGGG